MQSFLSVLVIVGALLVFTGNNAEGTSKQVYYATAAGLWILTVVLAYNFLI
jgi:hypothetical protein